MDVEYIFTGLPLENLPGGGAIIEKIGGDAFSNFNPRTAAVIMSFVLLEFQGGEIFQGG